MVSQHSNSTGRLHRPLRYVGRIAVRRGEAQWPRGIYAEGAPLHPKHKCEPVRNGVIRRNSASIMPFIAMAVILLMGTVGIASESTRIFEATRQLKFAAQSAALYACSLSTNTNGGYSIISAQSNIQNAVLAAGTAAWNKAECGPIGNVFVSGTVTKGSTVWSEPVTFAGSDVQFVNNPLDQNEFFTQVTARRENADALQQFFLPLLWLYSNPIGTQLPASEYKADIHQTVEVIGQPATRIGAGAPLAANNTSFIGWACLPLAISNAQFAAAADPSQTTPSYIIDLVSPSNTAPLQAGHIRGCFVNLSAGSGNNYYGSGTGSTAVNQLISLLSYFSGKQASTAPAMVEQGSQLNAFDPTNAAFVSQQTQVIQAITPNKFYIVPVLANDPVFGGNNIVVGFARLNLDTINTSGNGAISSLTVDIGESVPMYNTASVYGYSSIPGNTNNLMPAPVAPFLPRQYDSASGGVAIRPRGVILAPAMSPRQIKFS